MLSVNSESGMFHLRAPGADVFLCKEPSEQLFEFGDLRDPFAAAPLRMDTVGFAEGRVVFALRAAVHRHKVRLRILFPPHKRSSAYMYHFMAGRAHGDYAAKFLYVFFVVVFPYLVRFQPSRAAAYRASAARAGVCCFAHLVPHFPRQSAPKVRIPTAVRHELKIQFIFLHKDILTQLCPLCNRRAAFFIQNIVSYPLKANIIYGILYI